jgi:hypothetical protein
MDWCESIQCEAMTRSETRKSKAGQKAPPFPENQYGKDGAPKTAKLRKKLPHPPPTDCKYSCSYKSHPDCN